MSSISKVDLRKIRRIGRYVCLVRVHQGWLWSFFIRVKLVVIYLIPPNRLLLIILICLFKVLTQISSSSWCRKLIWSEIILCRVISNLIELMRSLNHTTLMIILRAHLIILISIWMITWGLMIIVINVLIKII